MVGLSTFDAAEYLDSDEAIVAYLNEVLDENDPEALSEALGTIARARGMTQLARDTGITRDGLYKAFSGHANPSVGTVQKVIHALGYELKIAIPAG